MDQIKNKLNIQNQFFNAVDIKSHFHLLFNHLQDTSFFVKNSEGELIFVDDSLLKLYGFDEEHEIVGKTDFELLPVNLAEKYRKDDLKIIESGKPLLNIVELFLNDQGIPGWFRTNKMPLKNSLGKSIGVMGTIRFYREDELFNSISHNIRPALLYIKDNYKQKIAISELASLCHISIRQFERIFKKNLNTTPQQFIIKRRIYEACELIKNNQTDLCSIALDLGFYDQSTLTRQFSKLMGVTPTQYRNKYL